MNIIKGINVSKVHPQGLLSRSGYDTSQFSEEDIASLTKTHVYTKSNVDKNKIYYFDSYPIFNIYGKEYFTVEDQDTTFEYTHLGNNVNVPLKVFFAIMHNNLMDPVWETSNNIIHYDKKICIKEINEDIIMFLHFSCKTFTWRMHKWDSASCEYERRLKFSICKLVKYDPIIPANMFRDNNPANIHPFNIKEFDNDVSECKLMYNIPNITRNFLEDEYASGFFERSMDKNFPGGVVNPHAYDVIFSKKYKDKNAYDSIIFDKNYDAKTHEPTIKIVYDNELHS